jgi:hypothetical protein
VSPAVAGPFGNDSVTNLIVLCATVSTAVTLVGAFLLFGRRRRRADEPADGVLAPVGFPTATYGAVAYAPAAQGLGAASASRVPATRVAPTVDPGTGGTDVDMPRWRRPSLMAARHSDPVRGNAPAGSLTFAAGQATADGGERRLVRYRLVRLLDRPDEVAGATVDTLDEGDEVEVHENLGLYRRVTTPDGRSGWLHKMTLGELVDTTASEPAMERDVLLAYLSGRGTD